MSFSLKAVEWVGSSLDDLKEFPEEVQQVMGYALYLAQCGEKHNSAKPLNSYLAPLSTNPGNVKTCVKSLPDFYWFFSRLSRVVV